MAFVGEANAGKSQVREKMFMNWHLVSEKKLGAVGTEYLYQVSENSSFFQVSVLEARPSNNLVLHCESKIEDFIEQFKASARIMRQEEIPDERLHLCVWLFPADETYWRLPKDVQVVKRSSSNGGSSNARKKCELMPEGCIAQAIVDRESNELADTAAAKDNGSSSSANNNAQVRNYTFLSDSTLSWTAGNENETNHIENLNNFRSNNSKTNSTRNHHHLSQQHHRNHMTKSQLAAQYANTSSVSINSTLRDMYLHHPVGRKFLADVSTARSTGSGSSNSSSGTDIITHKHYYQA